jgi:hypothetical protein
VHVEVDFERQPFEVRFVSTPLGQTGPYDLSLRTSFEAPPALVVRVRQALGDYFALTQPLLHEELVFLRLSVTSAGSLQMSQSCRRRPGGAM